MEQSPKSPRGSGTLVLDDSSRPSEDELAATVQQSERAMSEPHAVDVGPVSFDTGRRYAPKRLIGRGGMGEVQLCADAWVGRDVALKVLRRGTGTQGQARTRFLREARVQGQLEHPSVVPVYDLGALDDGELFFTMKRVVGRTLEAVIAGLRDGDAEVSAAFSQRKLIGAMQQVCLAVAFAHRRGVIHRDLKPANIMLGDFGEVYVLDWGVAKIQGSADLELDDEVSGDRARLVQTQAGAVIGTPGYMAPEQVRGEPDAIGPGTDVYALGAILFEILALAPLHRGASLADIFASTLSRDGASPAEIAQVPALSPELDAICQRATRLDPAARFQSAREMSQALERYLEGARDAERRRELAAKHLADARAALARAGSGGEGAEPHQRAAIRDLGQALALDPANQDALRLLLEYVSETPQQLPPDAERALRDVERVDRARSLRRSAWIYMALFALMPALEWAGFKSWARALAIDVPLVALIGYLFWIAKPQRATPKYMRWAYVLNFALVASFFSLFGPLILVPGVAAASATSIMVGARANRLTRGALLLLCLCAVFLPLGLQLVGLIPPSYSFENGSIQILPRMIDFPKTATLIFWSLANLTQILAAWVLVGSGVDALVSAERRNFAQAWRLKQLLPSGAS